MLKALEILVAGLWSGGIFSLVALGFVLIYSASGVLNLGQGAFVLFGALICYSLLATAHWPLWLAMIGAVVATALIGLLTARLALIRALDRLSHTHLLMLTAGLLIFFQGVVSIVWGSNPYSVPSFSSEEPLDVRGVFVPTQALWVLGVVALVAAAMWWLLRHTLFGRALQACAENRDAALLMGIPVTRMVLVSFTLSAALGALGGAVIAPLVSLDFTAGSLFTNDGFIAMALGGMGNFAGAIAGGFTLGILQQLAAGYGSTLFSNAIALVALLAVLVFRPSGLVARTRGRRSDSQAANVRQGTFVPNLPPRLTWALVGAFVVIMAVLPLTLAGSGYLEPLVLVGIFFIAVLGLDVLMGITGQVSLGQAGFMAIGAYAAAISSTRYGLVPIVGLALGVVCALAVGFVLSVVTARLRGIYMALATFAFGLLVDSLLVGLYGFTGGPSGIVGIPGFSLGPLTFSSNRSYYYLIWGIAALLTLGVWNILRSDRGRALQAINTDQMAARALGINVTWYKTQAFLIAAAFGAIAGGLYSYFYQYLSPDLVSTQVSLALVTMLILGGEGTLVGSIIGIALIDLLPQFFQSLALYKTAVEGLLVVLILLYLPTGIVGGLLTVGSRLINRRTRTSAPAAPAQIGLAPAATVEKQQ